MRDSEIKKVIESGLLEAYLLGDVSVEERKLAEKYMAESAEIRKAFGELEESLEVLSVAAATRAPADLKVSVMEAVQGLAQTTESSSIDPVKRTASIKRMNRMIVAAAVAAFAFAAIAVSEWYRASNLESELNTLKAEYKALEETVQNNELQLASLSERYDRIADSRTEKIVLTGNESAPEFVIVAYWNDDEQISYLNVMNQPELPYEQCFQLWADVDGEMLNLGVIPASADGLVPLKFFANAESLNVTIEPKGGSEHPTVSRLVASEPIES